MTEFGAAYGDGNIFSVPVTGGTPTTLLSFNGTNGANPFGDLTLVGSTLYGMAENGGAYGDGVIFSIPVTGGTPTTLLSFNGTDGETPRGSLTLSGDGSTFYGMTNGGGADGDGTVFSIPVTGGTPTVLALVQRHERRAPYGDLTLNGSTLYGMNWDGGANGDGTIFSISVTGGTPAVLASFNGTDGANPYGDLTLSGSTLYGMAFNGGTYGGVIFSIPVTGGTPTTLLSFNGTNGANPYGSLTLSGSTLYGMAESGGANPDGTVFSIGAYSTFTVGGSAVAVDSGTTVTSGDTDITGASMTSRHQLSDGRFAQFHQSKRHQRQLLRWRAHLERQRHAGPVPGCLAIGHVLHHQLGRHRSVNFHDRARRRRHRQRAQQHGSRERRRGASPPVVTASGDDQHVHRRRLGRGDRFGRRRHILRHRHDRGHGHDFGRHAAIGRYAQFHQPKRHHRQLRQRRADFERYRCAIPIPGGPAIGHVLVNQRQYDHPFDFDHRSRQCVDEQRGLRADENLVCSAAISDPALVQRRKR